MFKPCERFDGERVIASSWPSPSLSTSAVRSHIQRRRLRRDEVFEHMLDKVWPALGRAWFTTGRGLRKFCRRLLPPSLIRAENTDWHCMRMKLTINVVRPSDTSEGHALPVMFSIYGYVFSIVVPRDVSSCRSEGLGVD